MSAPIKIGIIGTGIFAYRHLRAYTAAGIPESAIYADFLDLINDPNVEVVDVVVPIQYNAEIVKAAIAAKKHIIIEKPIAHNVDSAREIVLAAREAETVVAVAENWAYHPLTQVVAEYVQKGGIGEIVNFTYDSARPFNANSPYLATKWRQTPQHPGGYLSDGGVHDLAHLVPILGRFQSVSAFATKRHSIHAAEDTLATTIQLASGAVGVANFTFCSAGIKKMRLEVHGTAGSIRLIDDSQLELFDAEGKPVSVDELLTHSKKSEFEDVEGEMANLYDVVRRNGKLGITLDEAFDALAFFVAALQSAESRQVVNLARV
ncbi:hypothetical protein DFQ28_009992 [Apophysomyces sp. BC1034]|nr:hypothetical protein DFQ30_009655 [Apophysomyces sp. BC1015]KAG0173950.1 hypothetical protein DFQ29_007675 [Apophysomyces sp. BC1021]KAG0185072.1 hypothetical protein DFQ28_009992 [Apophysomyces sp. BC1034]